MSNLHPAQIIFSKIEFGKFEPEPKTDPEPLPEDFSEVLRGSCVMACAMVPVGPDGDEYNEDLVRERQRIGNGVMKIKGYLHTEPAASVEEISALMQTPEYSKWLRESKNSPISDYEERLREEELAEIEREHEEREQLWREYVATIYH